MKVRAYTTHFVLLGAMLAAMAVWLVRSDASAHELSDVTFVGSPEWVILHPDSIKPDQLLIRRYAVEVSRSSYSAKRDDPTQKLELIGPPSAVVNSMFFNCRRKKTETDFLVLHLPDTITLKSFPLSEWKPTIQIRTLADGESRAVQGEYIKGDLFLDLKDMETADFIKLMTSNVLMFEFGDRSDRGQLVFEEKTGATTMQEFIRTVLPDLVKSSGAQRAQFLNTSQALAACLHFKKTGRILDSATQASTALPVLIQEEINKAKTDCKPDLAVMKSGFLTEKDVNGDGVKDYVLDYGQFGCGDSLSLYCGSAGCLTQVYASLSEGDYVKVLDENVRGIKFDTVKRRSVMVIELHGSGCGRAGAAACNVKLYWNGLKFSPAN